MYDINENFFKLSNDDITLNIYDRKNLNDKSLAFYSFDVVSKLCSGKVILYIGHNYHTYFHGNVIFKLDNIECIDKIMPLIEKIYTYHLISELIFACSEDEIDKIEAYKKIGARLAEKVDVPSDYIGFYNDVKKRYIYKYYVNKGLIKLD